MDIQLLRCYAKTQDINALYREMLRNCGYERWYWHTPYNKYKRIDHLVVEENPDFFQVQTQDTWGLVGKWINLT